MENNENNFPLENTVITPPKEKPPKKKSFLSKKAIILASISLVLIACIVFVIFQFVLPLFNTPSEPTIADKYSRALNSIKKQNYDRAYSLLMECGDYKDSKELLQNFIVAYQKEDFSNYNAEGVLEYNYSTEYEYIYDEQGNLKQIDWYDEENDLCYSTKLEYHDNGVISHIAHYEVSTDALFNAETEYDEYGNLVSSTNYDAYSDNYSITIDYEYDDNGNIMRKREYKGYNKLVSDTEYEYDKKGKVILKTEHSNESNLAKTIYKYEYNLDDNLILESVNYEHSFGSFEEMHLYEYKYDKDGKLVQIISNEQDIASEIKYDKNGNLSYRVDYYDEENFSAVTTYKNNLVRSEKKYNTFGELTSEKKYENGKLILDVQYSEENSKEAVRKEYEYNEDGIAKTHTITSYESDLTTKSIFSEPIIIYNSKNIKILGELLNGSLFHSVL